MSTIHAFEGPSGSGKGWAAEHFTNYGKEFLYQPRPTLPRCLDNWAGAWSSSFLEYQAIAMATMSQKDVVVDRFLLSRWVYRAMQFNGNVLNKHWYAEMTRSVRRLKAMAVAEAFDRIGQAIYLHPAVEVYVLLPDPHTLELQRSKTGKLYPFSGPVELDLYGQLAAKLMSDPIPGIYVSIIRP